MLKICPHCKREFETEERNKKFCTVQCRTDFWHRRENNKRGRTIKIKEENKAYDKPFFITPAGRRIELKEDPKKNPKELQELQKLYYKD